LSKAPGVAFSRAKIASRISAMARAISRDFPAQTLDVVIRVEDAFIFAADLIREIDGPVVCHFVRTELRDVEMSGHSRREVFFSQPPVLKGRNVLIVDVVLRTGVTLDFLLKRLQAAGARSVRLAVLVDEPSERHVDLRPDYFGFVGASKQLVGYGLGGRAGQFRNLAYLGVPGRRETPRPVSGRTRARHRKRIEAR
jgi:hypoxanthine phosphoribosyltransferase